MGWQPNLRDEAKFYAKHLLAHNPKPKVAVLYQNDDFGKDLLNGLKEGLGEDADKMIVSAQNFQSTDPTIDSQMVILQNSGADALFLFTYAKQAAQAISKMSDLKWKPETYLHLGAASVGATFKPAGLDKSTGIMSAGFIKDVTDPEMGRRSRRQDLDRVDEGQHARSRPQRQPHRRRLQRGADAGAGSEAVRRQSHPREHHEAGRQPAGFPPRPAAAGQPHQHLGERTIAS